MTGLVGARIGYARVSTVDQNPERQLEAIGTVGRMFTDACSGKDTARPQLVELIKFCREGDTVVVHSMDRLARNLDDLRALVRELTSKGIKVEFIKERLTFTGEDSPMSTLLLSVMGAFAEFERSLIRERQKEGIALAKARGAFVGRKPVLRGAKLAALRELLKDKTQTISQMSRTLGISRETVYRYLRKFEPDREPARAALLSGHGETEGDLNNAS